MSNPILFPWFLKYGADGEIRTLTAFAATPSRWCVYQFHHVGSGKSRQILLNSGFTFAHLASHGYLGMSLGFAGTSVVAGAGVGTAGTAVAGALCGA